MFGTFGLLNSVVLLVYLAGMVGIGLIFSRRQTSTEEFFLAGRRMPWLVVGMSMFASLTSASTYLGVPGMAYGENTAVFFGVLISPIVAPLLIFTFYPVYRRLNVTTCYEFIEVRYGRLARLTVSGLFVLARLSWLGVVIYGPALAMNVATGMSLSLAILLMGVLATLYTVLGGLAAVLWTDAVQFVILVVGAIWVAICLAGEVPGGVNGIIKVGEQQGHLTHFTGEVSLFKFTAIAAMVSWFFVFMHDYGADQVTVQRLMATKDLKSTARAVLFNSFSDIGINGLLLFIGLGLFAFYQVNELPEGISGDRVMPYYIMHTLPDGVSGLLLTAIFAAAMSSMDSGINSISTVVVSDFVKPLRKVAAAESKDIMLARVLTIVLGVLATGAAFYASTIDSIVEAWSSFMSLFAGPILAIFLLGLLWKRASFGGWLVGCVVSITLGFIIQSEDLYAKIFDCPSVHWSWYMPISFLSCFVIGGISSLIFPVKRRNNNEIRQKI